MTKKENSASKLLDEVLAILKEKGFKFHEKTANSNEAVVEQSKPTKLGSHVMFRAIQNFLFSTIVGNKTKDESVICIIDSLIRRKMAKEFKFIETVRLDDGNNPNASEIAENISQALMFYDRCWTKIMSDKELDAIFNTVSKE